MVDPTSNLDENVSAKDAPACATCGAALVDHPDHRIVTWIADGEVQTAYFCDEGCRADWNGERD